MMRVLERVKSGPYPTMCISGSLQVSEHCPKDDEEEATQGEGHRGPRQVPKLHTDNPIFH